jgi:hypothetical protein
LVAVGFVLPVELAFANQEIFSPTSSAFGTKFDEWSGQWWQFVLSFPASSNPLFDATGDRCVFGQRGPVWFLMGSLGGAVTRACAIPEGKALLFPLINIVDVSTASQTVEELRAEIAPLIDSTTNLSVEVDGTPIQQFVKSQRKSRVRSMAFEVTLPEGNVFGLAPGAYSPAVDDGFYVMLKPLGVGPHTLHFHADRDGFSSDVTYHLTIVPVVGD